MRTPEKAEYPLIRTCQVPADGEEKLQVSLLPYLYGRQSQELSVGALPNFTYRSASPLPPDMVNTRFEAPEGTSRVKFSDWPDEPDWPVTGTPLVSSPRSEEHTSELQSLMRTSYAVFCLKKK